MATKPALISITQLVKSCSERFVEQELWLSDNLAEHLAKKYELEIADTVVMVDIDHENPVAKEDGGKVHLRYNGRFYPVVSDKVGNILEMPIDVWIDEIKKWFADQSLEAKVDSGENNLIMFTVFLDSIELAFSQGSLDDGSESEESEVQEGEEGEETAVEETEEAVEETEEVSEPEEPAEPEEDDWSDEEDEDLVNLLKDI
jgi:cobalamin biosynthesis protein CobT